eukprot:9632399-Ditylum_brightwellii.AAC.1
MKAKTAPTLKSMLLYKFQRQSGDNISTPLRVLQGEMGECIAEALNSQNVLGWDNFAKGQRSKYCGNAQQ